MDHEYSFLLEDPRPTLPDTNLWLKLLRAIPFLENIEVAAKLHFRIWTMRSIGVMLRYQTGVWRFVPILDGTGGYESNEEFEEDKKRYLAPYAKEISELLENITSR